MYKSIFALFAIIAVASAGVIGPYGLGGVSYTQRLNGYGPLLGVHPVPVVAKVGVAPVLGVGHVGLGHVGLGHVGFGHIGYGVGHVGLAGPIVGPIF